MKKRVITRSKFQGGFALPTVLIASIIMLTVLVAAVTSTAAISVSLRAQYYNQLARTAGEAGIVYAKKCIEATPAQTWAEPTPLMSNTNCAGTSLTDCATDTICPVMGDTGNKIRSTFRVTLSETGGTIRAKGTTSLLRSDGVVWRTYSQTTIF